MKLFFSGTDTMGEELGTQIVPRCPWRLLSVHRDYVKVGHEWMRYVPDNSDVEIMLDSGAFTAWTKGQVLTVDAVVRAYDEFLQRYSGKVSRWTLINLDVMPGNLGRIATAQEIKECTQASDRNFEVLKRRFGTKMLPVYHQFETTERLNVVLEQGEGYIGVSPRNDFPEAKRLQFAKNIHYAINGRSKTHGLGATGFRMMTLAPWHSVDSISWVMTAGLGQVQWFDGAQVLKVDMSLRDVTHGGQVGSSHYSTIHESISDALDARAAEYGFTIAQLQGDHRYRKAFNLLSAVEMVREMERHPLPDQGDMFEDLLDATPA